MKRSALSRGYILPMVLMLLVSCSGSGQYSSDSGGGGGSTTVSGKVSLSGTASKPLMAAAKMSAKMSAAKAMPKTISLAAGNKMDKVISSVGVKQAGELAFATVELYNADRPEWLYPVAVSLTDSIGDYTLDALTNAANNTPSGGTAPYTDGDEIPAGKYTVIASKFDTNTGKLYVAVQAIVKSFDGNITGNDLVAQDSDAVPSVSSMIGLPKNADGTFGGSATNFSQRGAVQITFSMAMSRLSLMESILLLDGTTPVQGIWKVSADLLSVTFYPASDLTAGTVYTVRIGGGIALKTAKNIYGRKLPATVIGTFKASLYDPTAPEAVKDTPQPGSSSNVSITTPIRFASTEPLDLNTLYVTSDQDIGDKPAVLFVGRLRNDYWPFVYQIIPSKSLNVNTTYRITVKGGRGLDGDVMTDLQFNFTTETVSVGVTDATTAAVKDVFGKWVNALNSRNSALLTTYMTGDFYWVTNPDNNSSDDLNRDGRLSLKEFTDMLNNWFSMLELCDSTVTGDIVDNPADPDDGINVTGATAHIAFHLALNSTNTAPACGSDGGPPDVMYAELQNINGAWIMTRGSEIKPGNSPAYPTYVPSLDPITLVAPANGKQFAEPTATSPLLPTFQWAANAGITTYAIILIDARSQWQEKGWVALVDGSNAAAGTTMSMKFSSLPGDFGNTIVFGRDGLEDVGFWRKIDTLKAGGSYYWSVIGFNTITLDDLRLNRDPADPTMPLDAGKYVSASSEANNFSVAGIWRDMKMTVKNYSNSITYPYSIWYQGYDVGTESIVNLEFETPNLGATTAVIRVEGYTWQEFNNIQITNGKFSLPMVILSNKRTRIQVSDGMDPDLDREFQILTTGGALPKLKITSIVAKDCASGSPATLVGPDFWDNYTGTDVCTIDVSGTVDPSITGTQIWLNVWNNDGNGRDQAQQAPVSGAFSFTGLKVFQGFNWISLDIDDGTEPGLRHRNGFGLETATGSTYIPPIEVTSIDVGSKITSNLYELYWDAGAATTATITGVISAASSAGYNQYSDPNWMYVGSGTILTLPNFNLTITLHQGWNIVDIWDDQNNFYRVFILTSGGTINTPPHTITSVSDSGGPMNGPPYNTSDCTIDISGTTVNGANGPVQLNMNNYNSSTGQSIYESQSVDASGTGYDFTGVSVYYGSNYIDIWDAQWNWQGFEVINSNPACVATIFEVTGISPGTPNQYGEYDAGSASSVTIGGTAKDGRTITFYVNGLYYKVLETTAGAVVPNTFSLSVPIYNGYNYISITDGYNWIDKTVFTAGGATYTPSIYNVTVSPGSMTGGGSASDNWSNWDAGSASSITISGSADVDGIGNYYLSGSYTMSGNFTITGGSFSVPVNLGQGWNYISLYDKVGNGYYLNVYTQGGAAPVQVVDIANPTHDAQITTTSAVTVTGGVDESAIPSPEVRAYVYDFKTYTEKWYSTVPNEPTPTGTALPLSYTPGAASPIGTFSFDAQINGGNMTYIEVTATSPTGGSHGHSIYVNNELGYGSNFWKPGTKLSKSGAIARAHMVEAIKKRR